MQTKRTSCPQIRLRHPSIDPSYYHHNIYRIQSTTMGNGPSRCGFGPQTVVLDMTDIPYYDTCPWSRESEEERPFRRNHQGSMPGFGHHMPCPPSCYGPCARQQREAGRFARRFDRDFGRGFRDFDRNFNRAWRRGPAGAFGNGSQREPEAEPDNRRSAAPGSARGSAAPGSVRGSIAPGSVRGSESPGSSRRSAAPETVRGSRAPGSDGRAPSADDVREYRRAPSLRSSHAPTAPRRRGRAQRTHGSDFGRWPSPGRMEEWSRNPALFYRDCQERSRNRMDE